MKIDSRLAAAVTAAALMTCAAVFQASAEVVFLRDGRIVEGKILNETPAAVTVKKRDGSTAVFGRGAVLRILYTDVYMGKVYIHRTDGKVVEAFIVDEDRETYTVRTDLNSTKEMVIRRQDVLFMARKNPSALKEKVAQRHVDLAWLAPFNPVKHYKVYIRPRGGEYRLDGTSLFARYRVSGLACNGTYSTYVTAVDRDNYESLPSNEVHFTTLKGEPLPPGSVSMKVTRPDKKKPFNARIAWDRAKDPCGGSITDYRLYRRGAKGYTLVGATKKTEWDLKNLDPLDKHRFVLRSVDDRNVESVNSAVVSTDLIPGAIISARGGYILPIRDYGKLYRHGFGGSLAVYGKNLFTRWLDIGAETGFYYLFGKARHVKSAWMVPFMAAFACRVPLADWVSIGPRAAFGGVYDRVKYVPEVAGPAVMFLKPPVKEKGAVQMMFSIGVNCSFTLKDVALLEFGADYRGIIEKSGLMDFMSFYAGAGATF
ncbi:MAG: hypothetical protein KA369_09745 [Spirochaetes bacterium]|nr:hypothetical protein [Spirochaetota bacterium]